MTLLRVKPVVNKGSYDAEYDESNEYIRPFLSQITGDPTGFFDPWAATTSFNNTNRTFTITPVSGSYTISFAGILHFISTAKSIQIPDVYGKYYIYFDTDDELHYSTVFTDSIILEKVLVAVVRWCSISQKCIYKGNERHSNKWSKSIHLNHHQTEGTKLKSFPELGFAIGNYSLDGDGTSNSHAQFSLKDGYIWDEDLELPIRNGIEQTLSTILYAPIYYKQSITGDYMRDDATAFACKRYGTGRLAYNNYNGGNWTQTEVPEGKFVCALIIATNDEIEPIKIRQGTAWYETLGKAKTGAQIEARDYYLSGDLFIEEYLLGVVTFQTKSSFTNSVKAIMVSQDDQPWLDLRTSSKSDITSNIVNVIENVTFVGGMSFGSSLTPPAITTDQNSYYPTDLFNYIYIRLSSTKPVKINGIKAPNPVVVQTFDFRNVGTNNITIKALSGAALSNEQLDIGKNVTLGPKDGIVVRYDDVDLKWVLTGSAL